MNYSNIIALKNFIVYRKEEKKPVTGSFVTSNEPSYKNVVVSVGENVTNISAGDEIICGRYGENPLHLEEKTLYAIKADDVVGINKGNVA